MRVRVALVLMGALSVMVMPVRVHHMFLAGGASGTSSPSMPLKLPLGEIVSVDFPSWVVRLQKVPSFLLVENLVIGRKFLLSRLMALQLSPH